MISSVLVSLIFKDIRLVSFILSQRSIYDTFSTTGSVSFNLRQFALWPLQKDALHWKRQSCFHSPQMRTPQPDTLQIPPGQRGLIRY
jgi:hypothetical protein